MDRRRLVIEMLFFAIMTAFGLYFLLCGATPYKMPELPVPAPFGERMNATPEGGISYDPVFDEQSEYRSA